MEFEGRRVIVTGGASGIGAASARAFARAGAKVAIIDIQGATAAALAAEIAGSAFEADVCNADIFEQALLAAAAWLGGVDVLVNNAGGGRGARLTELATEDWRGALDLNLTSTFLATRVLVPALIARGEGAIVNVSSLAGKHVSLYGGAAYAAAKAGVLALTRQTAAELAVHRIRANAVCPGPTVTALTRNSSRNPADTIPLGEWVMPQDVAEAILFFAGRRSRMCTGTSLDIDGGLSVARG